LKGTLKPTTQASTATKQQEQTTMPPPSEPIQSTPNMTLSVSPFDHFINKNTMANASDDNSESRLLLNNRFYIDSLDASDAYPSKEDNWEDDIDMNASDGEMSTVSQQEGEKSDASYASQPPAQKRGRPHKNTN
jgi:hypothetical protein